MFFREPLKLLPKEDVLLASMHDPAAAAYSLSQGWLHRAGIRLGIDLLPNRVNRLLQIGFGSGIFMPELDSHANQLYGIDSHAHRLEVSERLRVNGVHPRLSTSNVEEMPFENGYFERVISFVTLESVLDLDMACREIIRVLHPDGRLVLVLPGAAVWYGLSRTLLNGRSYTAEENQRRSQLLPTLLQFFDVVRSQKFPALPGNAFCLYQAFDLEPKSAYVAPVAHESDRIKVAV